MLAKVELLLDPATRRQHVAFTVAVYAAGKDEKTPTTPSPSAQPTSRRASSSICVRLAWPYFEKTKPRLAPRDAGRQFAYSFPHPTKIANHSVGQQTSRHV